MRRLLVLSYLGTGFCGWQKQPGKPSVQQALETALSTLYGAPVSAVASGRTDEGVHALGQAVHFDEPEPLRRGALSPERLIGALNHYLPPQIRALSVRGVPSDFHARKSAHKKTYEYRFYLSETENPFFSGRAARLSPSVDFTAMAAAAPLFDGAHDFAAFRLLGSSAKTTVRTVYGCALCLAPDDCGCPTARLTVAANGFLYKMVRLIVGALTEIGLGKLNPALIPPMLLTGECLWQKKPAPPFGLYLRSVDYGFNGENL